MNNKIEHARDAMRVIATRPAWSLDNWKRTCGAIKAAGLDLSHFEEWSSKVPASKVAEWDRESPTDVINTEGAPKLNPELWWMRCPDVGAEADPAPLYDLADRNGPHPGHWRDGGGMAEVWAACSATAGSWWLEDKVGMPTHKLRVKPEGLRVMREHRQLRGCLVVPMTLADGTMDNLLLIEANAPLDPEGARPEAHPLLPDTVFGWFTLGVITPGAPVYVCATLEDAWACWRATGAATVLVYGWEDCGLALGGLRQHNPDAALVLVPSMYWAETAEDYAVEFDATVANLFPREGADFGAYDLLKRDGRAALKRGLELAAEAARPVAISGPRFNLLSSADLDALPPMAWRVRGVLPTMGLAGLYGPSGSGKSFLALDMAAAIAEGRRWFDCQVEAASVVYVALEGEAGFRVRVAAWEAHHGRKLPNNLHLVLQPFKLTQATDVDELAAVVPAGAMVVIDTLNRAAPNADENSSKDMGEILEGSKRLQTRTQGLVLLVHHTGKDVRQGMRGHSSLIAALDAAVEVSKGAEGCEWKVTKAKDGAEGDAHPFVLKVETLGVDDHGDDITSCVVTDTAESISTQRERLPRGPKAAMVALHLVIAQQGIETPPSVRARFGLLAPTRVVTEDTWRQASYLEGITGADADQDSKRKAFTRARAQLLDLTMMGAYDGFVWPKMTPTDAPAAVSAIHAET